MKTKFFISAVLFLLIIISAPLRAGVLSELKYVSENSDIYTYANAEDFFLFAGKSGISSKDIPFLMGEELYEKTEDALAEFGLSILNVKEVLSAVNSREVEKKSGMIMMVSISKKILIPDKILKTKHQSGKSAIYLIDKQKKFYFTISDVILVFGQKNTIENYLKKRKGNNVKSSTIQRSFIADCKDKTFYMNIHVSSYIKEKMENAVKQGAVLGKGLDANVFIKAITALQSIDMGMSTNRNGVTFFTGLQGANVSDGKRLLMISHFTIVGSSLALTLADMYARRKGSKAISSVTSNRRNMEKIQQYFGRIKTRHSGNSAVLTFSFNMEETREFVVKLTKQIDKEKQNRLARYEREKISRLNKLIISKKFGEVEKALSQKININTKGNEGNTLLFTAAQHGNLKLVEQIISMGADINGLSGNDYAPLHGAVIGGKSDNVKFLIKKGADVNVKTRDRSTPLHYAAAGGDIQIVKILAGENADPDVFNRKGERAVDIADKKQLNIISEFLKNEYKYNPPTDKN